MARARRRFRVIVADERGRSGPASGLARWLARVAPPAVRGIVSVAVVSDARIRALNLRYRRRDQVTDVLSFPYDPADTGPAPAMLGDIVIARGVARRQARDQGHSERIEMRVLALHGLLHLLGYDHHRDGGRMLRAEQRLLRKGGLRDGLVARGVGGMAVRRRLKRPAS
jgi:probable rRNA maturation factor